MKFERTSPLTCAVIAALFGSHAARAELQLGIEFGGGYSDNIGRVETNENDEKIGSVGLDLSWTEQTRRLSGDATIDMSYFEYFDDTYDGEVLGIADVNLDVAIVPERFTWVFQDSFGQVQTDPFAPITPEERENLNYFTTGPDVNLRLGSATSLRLLGRYSLSTYEESPLDSDRRTVGAALARQLSQQSEIALNAVRDQVDMDDPATNDYDRDSIFLSYDLVGSRTELSVELGYMWLEPDGGERDGGLLARIAMTREVSASSTIEIELGTQFMDAGEALRGAVQGGASGGGGVTASGDPFENQHASFSWDFQRNRTGLSLGIGWDQDRYEVQTEFDRTLVTYEGGVTRQISPTMDFGLTATLNDEDFDTTGLKSDELVFGTSLTWHAGRRISFALLAERIDRDTSDGTGEYVENRFFLTATYRPLVRPE
jgi:hypothetical protein